MSSECTVTIQDVFNRFYPEYERSHKLSAVQRKAAYFTGLRAVLFSP